jgi:hypothetical protein
MRRPFFRKFGLFLAEERETRKKRANFQMGAERKINNLTFSSKMSLDDLSSPI